MPYWGSEMNREVHAEELMTRYQGLYTYRRNNKQGHLFMKGVLRTESSRNMNGVIG